jgi:membrane protein YdbS with pleckstrin-like domain
MTNSPDQPIAASDSPTVSDAARSGDAAGLGRDLPAVPAAADLASAPGAQPAAEASSSGARDAVLDADAYSAIVEPRSENRLPLGDGAWHQISPKYLVVQLISNGAVLALIVAAALVLWLVMHMQWVLIPAAIGIAITLATLVVVPRQARSIGYQLRTDDLVFRRGILWQRMVAVPYGRMQLVDITHGPLDRVFGIAQLKLVTAAAATGVTIPGLSQAAAERLRDTLIDVAETRRTGL